MSKSNSENTSSIVSKVWAFCNTLRDDGGGDGNCLNQDLQDDRIFRMARPGSEDDKILFILKSWAS